MFPTYRATRSGGVKLTVENDTLCVFEVTDSGGISYREFCFVTAVSSQSGTHKPEQVFVCLDKHDESKTDISGICGLILVLSTRPYVQPTEKEFFQRQPLAVGQMRMYTSDCFVARLLDLPKLFHPDLVAVKVAVSFLQFEDILPGMIRVIGVDVQNPCLFATADEAVVDTDGPEDHSPQHSEHGVSSHLQDSSGGVDFLALLEASAEPRPPKQRKTTRSKLKKKTEGTNEPDVSIEEALGDFLLDDLSVTTFLSREEIEGLKHVQGLCATASTANDLSEWRPNAVPEDASSESGDEQVEEASLDGDNSLNTDGSDGISFTHDKAGDTVMTGTRTGGRNAVSQSSSSSASSREVPNVAAVP